MNLATNKASLILLSFSIVAILLFAFLYISDIEAQSLPVPCTDCDYSPYCPPGETCIIVNSCPRVDVFEPIPDQSRSCIVSDRTPNFGAECAQFSIDECTFFCGCLPGTCDPGTCTGISATEYSYFDTIYAGACMEGGSACNDTVCNYRTPSGGTPCEGVAPPPPGPPPPGPPPPGPPPPPGSPSVSLAASPSSGTGSIDSTLTATVSGGSGSIRYAFWWNCTDPTTSLFDATVACGSPPVPSPGFCASNSVGYQCLGVTDNPKSTSPHTYTTGSYTAKVIIERAGSAQAQRSITVSPSPPPPPPSPPNPPTNLLISNSTCGQLDLSWTDNSSNETNFRVWRSPASGTAFPGNPYSGNDYNLIATLPANSTSYSDTTVSGGTAYRYIVTSFNAVGDSTVSSGNAAGPTAATSCAANLNNSSKTVDQVNGVPYTTQTIRDGNTVTFKIVINNNLGSDTAYDIDVIDTLSENLDYVSGSSRLNTGSGPAPVTPSISGKVLTYSNLGDLPAGSSWELTFQTAIDSASSQPIDFFLNTAVIRYDRTEADNSDNQTKNVGYGPVPFRTDSTRIPDIDEVAP